MEKQSILNELYLLDKGVRDCFCETVIDPEDLDFIIEEAVHHNYYVYTHEFEDKCDKKTIYIAYVCKYNYQKIMLHKMYTDSNIDKFTKEYIEGTLLGYSAQSMEEYLIKMIVNDSIDPVESGKPVKISAPV